MNIRIAVAGTLMCLGVGGAALGAMAAESPPSPPPDPHAVVQDGQTVAEGRTPGGQNFTIKALSQNDSECLMLVDQHGLTSGGCGPGLNGEKMVVEASLSDGEVVLYPLLDESIDKIVVTSKTAKLRSARTGRAAGARKVTGKSHKMAVAAVPAPRGGLGGIQVTAVDSAGNVVATHTIPDGPGGEGPPP